MSKDHVPSDFDRQNGYKSDLEKGETMPGTKSVNTSFGGRQHNVYTIQHNGTHEHYYYNPQQLRCGYHGANFETRHNHPQQPQHAQEKTTEEKTERPNSFVGRLEVEKATLESQPHPENTARSEAQQADVQAQQGKAAENGSGHEAQGNTSGNASGGQSNSSSNGEGHDESGHGNADVTHSGSDGGH